MTEELRHQVNMDALEIMEKFDISEEAAFEVALAVNENPEFLDADYTSNEE